jgi:hypothetical protein
LLARPGQRKHRALRHRQLRRLLRFFHDYCHRDGYDHDYLGEHLNRAHDHDIDWTDYHNNSDYHDYLGAATLDYDSDDHIYTTTINDDSHYHRVLYDYYNDDHHLLDRGTDDHCNGHDDYANDHHEHKYGDRHSDGDADEHCHDHPDLYCDLDSDHDGHINGAATKLDGGLGESEQPADHWILEYSPHERRWASRYRLYSKDIHRPHSGCHLHDRTRQLRELPILALVRWGDERP